MSNDKFTYLLDPAPYTIHKVTEFTEEMHGKGMLEISKKKYLDIKKKQRRGEVYVDDIDCVLSLNSDDGRVVLKLCVKNHYEKKTLLNIIIDEDQLLRLKMLEDEQGYIPFSNIFVSTFTELNRDLIAIRERMKKL